NQNILNVGHVRDSALAAHELGLLRRLNITVVAVEAGFSNQVLDRFLHLVSLDALILLLDGGSHLRHPGQTLLIHHLLDGSAHVYSGLGRFGPSPLLGALHGDERVVSTQEIHAHRDLVLLVIELGGLVPSVIGHTKDTPRALLNPCPHNLFQDRNAFEHGPGAQGHEAAENLLDADGVSVPKQELLEIHQVCRGGVLTCKQFALINERPANKLEERRAAFTARRTQILAGDDALSGRIVEASIGLRYSTHE